MRQAVRVWLGALTLLAVAACSSAPSITPPEPESRIDVDTPALRTAKAQARVAACPVVSGDSRLPAVELPCLGGGRSVDLASVRGPAVLPLWASWCKQCPAELPIYQRLAELAGPDLTVLGVDYQDTQPDVALQILRRAGARFPQVADPGGVLAEAYRIRGLPGVLLVAADGEVTFETPRVTRLGDLVTLVSERLGVDVATGGRG